MKERPILFSAPMVNAILEGRKTQTRRVAKEFPLHVEQSEILNRFPNQQGCPYGKVGDRLWVRETWRPESDYFEAVAFDDGPANVSKAFDIRYATDPSQQYWHDVPKDEQKKYTQAFQGLIDGQSKKWHPSIHMPRWASRITLEITNVHVERLQDISEEDAKAEGVPNSPYDNEYPFVWRDVMPISVANFHYLWDKINGKKAPWESNPWVWVLEFKKCS